MVETRGHLSNLSEIVSKFNGEWNRITTYAYFKMALSQSPSVTVPVGRRGIHPLKSSGNKDVKPHPKKPHYFRRGKAQYVGSIDYINEPIIAAPVGIRLPSKLADLTPTPTLRAVPTPEQQEPAPNGPDYASHASTIVTQITELLKLKKTQVNLASSTGLAFGIAGFLSSLHVALNRRDAHCKSWIYFVPPISALGSIASNVAVLITNSDSKVNFDVATATETASNLAAVACDLANQPDDERHDEPEGQPATANGIDLDLVLHWACSLLSVILTAGFSACGWSFRDLNTILTTREKTKTLSKDLHVFVRDLLDECGGSDLKKNKIVAKKYHDLLERCTDVFCQRVSVFVTNKASYDELVALIKDIDKLVGTKIDLVADKPYTAAKSLLCQHYSRLITLKTSVDRVADFTDRQTCIGIVLQGPPGVGKSFLARHLCKEIAKYLNYNPAVYNAKPGPNGNFFEAYASQSFGEWNEFAASVNTKRMVEKLNEIVSGDACNLEGADLAFKHQPCRLNLLVLTANREPNDVYDFTGTDGVTEQANLAFLSRIMRYDVRDPSFTSRSDDNPHRRSDFSHLVINKIDTRRPECDITRLDEYRDVELRPISVPNLINDLVRRIAKQEREFIRLKLIPRCDPGEIKDALLEDFAILTGIIGDGLAFANGATNTVPIVVRVQGPPGCGKTTTALVAAQRIAATMGTKIIEINDVEELADPKNIYSRPCVYILNDIPVEKFPNIYMSWIARTNYRSLIIFTTNVICRPVRVASYSFRTLKRIAYSIALEPSVGCVKHLCTSQPEVVMELPSEYRDAFTKDPGLIRRVGLTGPYKVPGYFLDTYDVIPANAGLCITLPESTKEPSMYFNNTKSLLRPYDKDICEHYLTRLRSGPGPVRVKQPAPAVEADVTILIRNPSLWIKQAQSTRGYVDMFLRSDHPAGSVAIRPQISQYLMDNCNPSTWVLPTISTAGDIENAREPLLMRLLNCMPSLTVVIKTPSSTLTHYDGCIYDTKVVPNNIVNRGGLMFLRDMLVPPCELAEVATRRADALNAGRLNNFTFTEIETLVCHVRTNMNDPDLRVYAEAFISEQAGIDYVERFRKSHPIWQWMILHEKSLKIAASIFAVVTGVIVAWRTIKYFTQSGDDDKYTGYSKANGKGGKKAWSDTDSNDGHKKSDKTGQADYERDTRRYIEGLGSLYHSTHEYAQHLAQERGSAYAERWHRKIDNSRANACQTDRDVLAALIDAGYTDEKQPAVVFKFAIDHGLVEEYITLSRAKQRRRANAVQISYMNTKPESVLEQACERIRKNVVYVSGGSRSAYGIGVCNRLVVTVAHAVSRGHQALVKWSPTEDSTKTYSVVADILFYCHERDVAILKINDSKFPEFRDISKMFKYEADMTSWSCAAYFARTVPGGIVYSGRSTYLGRTRPLIDRTLPGWGPTKFINYTALYLPAEAGIFKPGDCGLPLIVIEDNTARIVGIHNSIDASGIRSQASFAPVYYDDISAGHLPEFQVDTNIANAVDVGIKDNPNFKLCKLASFEAHVMSPDYTEFLDKTFGTELWSNHPEIEVIGQCARLKSHSRPRFAKNYLRSEECITNVDAIPSPTAPYQLTEKAKEHLPKDIYGLPVLLLAQVKKMFNREHPIEFDDNLHQAAYNLILESWSARYGNDIRPLRIHSAINGVIGGALNKIELSTSPGPYIKYKYKLHNKHELFVNHNPDGNVPAYYFADTPIGRELETDVNRILHSFRNGHPVTVFIKDNAKVELLEPGEVEEEGKVRQFCELDLAFNIAVRIILGDLLDAQVLNYSDAATKTGFNCYTFPNGFLQKVPTHYKYECLDAKRLDKQYPTVIMNAFFSTVAQLTKNDEMKQMLAALALSLHRTIHISWPEPIMYVQTGGNPSGITGTTSINCYLSEFMVAVSYIRAVNNLGLHGARNFGSYIHHVKPACLGDDLLVYINPDLYPHMNAKTLEQTYNSYGLGCVSSKNFNEKLPEFCSRAIMYDPHEYCYYSKLKKRSVLQSIFYVHTGENRKTLNAFKTALFEASFHDEKFFKDVVHDIKAQMRLLGIPLEEIAFFSWQEQRSHFFEYVRGQQKSPVLTGWDPEMMYSITAPIVEWEDRNMTDYVSKYYTTCAQQHLPCAPTDTAKRDSISGEWRVAVTDQGFGGEGRGPQKRIAREGAFHELYKARFGESNTANALLEPERHKHAFRYTVSTDTTCQTKILSVHVDDKHIVRAQIPFDTKDDTLKATLLWGVEAGVMRAVGKLEGSPILSALSAPFTDTYTPQPSTNPFVELE